jgi:tetratricopeptide (TPR) repeat protein
MVSQRAIIASVMCGVVFCVSVSYSLEEESLFSENTATLFIKQASIVHQEDPLDIMRTEQAMTLLAAAASLDITPGEVPEKMLRIGGDRTYDGQDYSGQLLWALDRYLNDRSDLDVVFNAMRSALDGLNSRIDREVFLEKLFRKYSSVNAAFASELVTQLGLLAVEKADMQSARNYLSAAVQLNPYNQLAFSKFIELSMPKEGEGFPPKPILLTRRVLEMNPYNLDSAVRYADMLRQLQMYDIASSAYEYVSQIHQFLYPDQSLPDDIVQDWLFSCYHGDRLQTNCLGLTETYRDPKHFNLVLEAVAGKTLIKLGRTGEGERFLESAAQKAEELALVKSPSEPVYPEYLAWFYSFVLEQPEKSLAWSNQAFIEDPNRQGVEAIFSYSLALNGQNDLAQQYAEPLKETDQIAALTMAMVQLSGDDKQAGLDALRAVVEMSPDSFIAEKAIRLLEEQESDYIPSDSLGTLRERLEKEYGSRLVPDFMPPAERCSVKLLFNGSDFLYGADFSGRLVIENTSDETLVISDEGMLQGHLRVDALLEGSLNVEIPDLLSMRFRPSQPILPGKHLSVPLDLNRGRLRRLLLTYPQADVQVHFMAYLDPTISASGKTESRMKSIKPVHAQIRRRGIVLSRDFLLQRLDVLSKGQPGQKYQAASMFTGLLAEQIAVDLSGADFEYVRVERALLIDSVRKMLVDKDWKIRVHTLSSLLSLSIPLDGIVGEVSENLNHDKWPVRLTAMVLLAKAQPETFQKVLDWAVQHDAHDLNRRMAIALGGEKPKPETNETAPEVTDSKSDPISEQQ